MLLSDDSSLPSSQAVSPSSPFISSSKKMRADIDAEFSPEDDCDPPPPLSPSPSGSSRSLLSLICLLWTYLFSARDLLSLSTVPLSFKRNPGLVEEVEEQQQQRQEEEGEGEGGVEETPFSLSRFTATSDSSQFLVSGVVGPARLFVKTWIRYRRSGSGIPFIRTFFFLYWRRVLLMLIPRIVDKVSRATLPWCLFQLLIEFQKVEVSERRVWWMVCVAFLSALFQLVRALALEIAWHTTHELRIEIMKCVDYVLYWKTLRVPLKATKEETNKISSLLGQDPFRISNMVFMMFNYPNFLVDFVIAFTYVGGFLGWPGIVFALAVLVGVLTPLNCLFLRWNRRMDEKKTELVDKRVSMVKEAIENIRFIKAFHWEQIYQEKILKVRLDEGAVRRKCTYSWNFVQCVWTCSAFLITASALAGYSYLKDEQLDMAVSFSVISVFQSITWPIFQFTNSLNQLQEGNTSRKRIMRYMNQPEVTRIGIVEDQEEEKEEEIEEEVGEKELHVTFGDNDSQNEISFSGCEFAWPVSAKYDDDDDSKKKKNSEEEKPKAEAEAEEKKLVMGPFLRDIDFSISRGEFVAVIGSVGSGKTCFANALLRELKCQGRCHYSSETPIAFCHQEHWILGRSVRENILFGAEFDESRYAEVVKVCCLIDDLEKFPERDRTKVGERGTRLSGGQKARLALARACYQIDSCDVYVFDDPLKDLDAKVTNHVFKECFLKWLIGKTRILFTHNLQVLPHVDRVIVLDEGRIVQQGSYEQLRAAAEGMSHAELMRSPMSPLAMNPDDQSKKPPASSQEFQPTNDEEEEERELEKLGESFKYRLILKYVMAKPLPFALFILSIVLKCCLEIMRDYMIGMWSEDSLHEKHSIRFYLGVYFILGGVVAVIVILGNVVHARFALDVADAHHDSMLSRVLRAPVSWFDKATSGKILNRFSKDLQKIDDDVRWRLREALSNSIRILATYLFVIVYVPWFVLLMVGPIILFYRIGRVFYRAFVGYVRLESSLHSPILTHFNETVKGLTTIRAFKKKRMFRSECEKAIDDTFKVDMIDSTMYRWLSIRGRLVAIAILLLFTLVSVFSGLKSAVASIAMARMANMEFDVTWFLMLLPGLQKAFIGVERVQEYASLETEPLDGRELENFPSEGTVEFRDIVFRYESRKRKSDTADQAGENEEEGENDDVTVLKNVSLRFASCEKIGIVGRTGSGKSTLVKLLLRLYEPVTGEVLIDGVRISELSLKCLRKGMSYIAQNPTLLNGTVRENLDAESVFDDTRLWDALEQVGLAVKVRACSKQLEAEVGEEINFSSGEKQLLCFARALVHRKKLLVMDEATSSCDLLTDEKIQETVDRCFSDSTIIAIAHRLETVANYDRIVVVSEGEIVEFDTPRRLLEKEVSHFREMVLATGRRRSRKIFEMAGCHHDDEEDGEEASHEEQLLVEVVEVAAAAQEDD